MNIQPSPTSLSDRLAILLDIAKEIDNILLDREKLIAVQEASHLYNEVVSLASPSYFTEMEEAFIRKLGQEWNALVEEDNARHISSLVSEDAEGTMTQENMDDMKDQLEDFLNRLDEFKDDDDENN